MTDFSSFLPSKYHAVKDVSDTIKSLTKPEAHWAKRHLASRAFTVGTAIPLCLTATIYHVVKFVKVLFGTPLKHTIGRLINLKLDKQYSAKNIPAQLYKVVVFALMTPFSPFIGLVSPQGLVKLQEKLRLIEAPPKPGPKPTEQNKTTPKEETPPKIKPKTPPTAPQPLQPQPPKTGETTSETSDPDSTSDTSGSSDSQKGSGKSTEDKGTTCDSGEPSGSKSTSGKSSGSETSDSKSKSRKSSGTPSGSESKSGTSSGSETTGTGSPGKSEGSSTHKRELILDLFKKWGITTRDQFTSPATISTKFVSHKQEMSPEERYAIIGRMYRLVRIDRSLINLESKEAKLEQAKLASLLAVLHSDVEDFDTHTKQEIQKCWNIKKVNEKKVPTRFVQKTGLLDTDNLAADTTIPREKVAAISLKFVNNYRSYGKETKGKFLKTIYEKLKVQRPPFVEKNLTISDRAKKQCLSIAFVLEHDSLSEQQRTQRIEKINKI